MSVTNLWLGAVTDSGFTVRGKVVGASVRLARSGASTMASPVYTSAATPTAQGMVTFVVTGLSANALYHYALEVDGVLDTAWQGRARTAPTAGTPATFTYAAAACGGHQLGDTVFWPPNSGVTRVSNHPVYETIRTAAPALFIHMGDMHYGDLGSTDPAAYRDKYDQVLSAPNQGKLYKDIPLAYVWDDHDFVGDNSNSLSTGASTAAQVYREKVPHYPLAIAGDTAPVAQTWVWGRVRFIMLDCRAGRTPSGGNTNVNRTMLGPEQKAWLLNLIATATEPMICIVNPDPWIYPNHGDSTANTSDAWGGFTNERDEIAAAIVAAERDKGNLYMICGDAHCIAITVGEDNPYGGFPVFHFASLDSQPGGLAQGSAVTYGPNAGRGRYGLVKTVDTGSQITVTGSGYSMTTKVMEHTFAYPPVTEEEPEDRPDLRRVQEVRLAYDFEGEEVVSIEPTFARWGREHYPVAVYIRR